MAIPAPTHIEPHVERVTLNPAILRVARRIVVVMHGAGKAAILGDIFGAESDPRRWPAQLARREGATWILDEAGGREPAAALMAGPASRGAVTRRRDRRVGDAAARDPPRGAADAAGIGDVWLASWRATFDFEPGLSRRDLPALAGDRAPAAQRDLGRRRRATAPSSG